MSKVIQSPVEKWAGSITIADPLTAPQVFAIEDALDETAEIEPSAFKRSAQKDNKKVSMRWQSRYNYAYLPAVLACVESWDIENFPADITRDTFPSIQSSDASELIAFIFMEIMKVYKGDTEVPNA